MNAAERLALTSLCAELIGLRAEGALQSADKQRLLVRIEEEARARRPILPLLDQLLGTSRTETVRSLGSRLPGAGPGQSDEERFSCPDNVCDRSVVIEPAGAPPRDRSANETRSRWGLLPETGQGAGRAQGRTSASARRAVRRPGMDRPADGACSRAQLGHGLEVWGSGVSNPAWREMRMSKGDVFWLVG